MNGISRFCSSGPTIRLAGSTYEVHAWRLRDWGAAESAVLQLRGDLFGLVGSLRGSDDRLTHVFTLLQNECTWATYRDIMEWRQSWSGRVFTLGKCLRVAYDEAVRLLALEVDSRQSAADLWWIEEIEPAIDLANGDDVLTELFAVDIPKEEQGEPGGEATQWMQLLKNLGQEPFGMLPEAVLDQTLPQIHAMLWNGASAFDFGIGPKAIAAMDEHFKQRQKLALNAVRNIKEGKRWNSERSD